MALMLAYPSLSSAVNVRDKYVGAPARIPFVLYDECDSTGVVPYVASGWMGSVSCIERDDCWDKNPHSGETCIQIKCIRSRKWYGIAWQDPPGDWGRQPGGYDLRKARKLTLWARGEKGGEKVEFNFGIVQDRSVPYPDSTSGKPRVVELTTEWKQYTVYAGGDKRCIKTGFAWAAAGTEDGITFYLDDIQYED